MRSRGEIEPIGGLRRVYRVTVPYARNDALDETEALLEANPYAVLSHLSAMAFHGLTDQVPRNISVVKSLERSLGLLALDTEPNDWEGVELPGGRTPAKVQGRHVVWTRVKPERFFGFATYRPSGFAFRVTTGERTLIDAVQESKLCGGMENVLQAWVAARDMLDVDTIVQLVDRLDVAVLRQRVGYILEQLALSRPRLDVWNAHAHRGGSSKLVGSEDYQPVYDERWNLSLNGPVWVLADEAA